MRLLNDDESLELLCGHAFRSKLPPEDFEDMASQAVRYCEGNPLALVVLGSSLSMDNSIQFWESTLQLFGRDIHENIRRGSKTVEGLALDMKLLTAVKVI
ncbi:hypothetical protein L2E82_38379 [Cichorium intybus]|uniref:Uncharacterized protein n=1 Tax=Cichorium intybus TaxID=13427 RepID=A0ACB9AF87_CICIN|nr:hypothetical protein L2E82_38379 [Cichorium intybus]